MPKRVARTRAGGEWTEARYWSFIRSGLRQMSRRWPPIVRQIMHAGRREYQGPNPRQKWEYLCEGCNRYFPAKEIAVDHKEECGSLRSLEDIPGFVDRLFCEVDKLRRLCDECHEKRHDEDEE